MQGHLDRLAAVIKQPEDVLAASGVFSELARDRAALKADLVARLRNLSDNPAAQSQAASSSQIVLSQAVDPSAVFDVALSRHRTTTPSVVTTYIYALICPLNTRMNIEHYLLPEDWDCAVFSADVSLQRMPDLSIAKGEVFAISPGRNAYRFVVSETTLVLKLTSRHVLPFEWSFDPRTLKAWQSISSIPAETNLVHACRAAAVLGDRRFVELLSGLLNHRSHTVRWEALKSLCLIDRESGWKGLETLSADKHPHVRRAAERVRRQHFAPSEA